LLGFADDLPILASAVAYVAMHIDDCIKARASVKLRDWFGAPAG
jgi:hypothetical protein